MKTAKDDKTSPSIKQHSLLKQFMNYMQKLIVMSPSIRKNHKIKQLFHDHLSSLH